MNKYLLLCILTFLSLGCKPPKSAEAVDEVLAKVGDQELYFSEVQKKVAEKLQAQDSAQVYSEYIQNWITQTVLIEKAHAILSASERDKSALVSQYYNDLIIHELKQKMLNERLDTGISDGAIEGYYNNNKKNFELKENIVRFRFFSIPNDVKNPNKLWNMFTRGKEKDLEALRRLCELKKVNFFYNDSAWLSFNDVLKEIPITTYNQESFLNNNRFIRLTKKDVTYFVHILDFKVKDNISPLDFEKDRIKNIIIHKRKVELLQQIEDEIVRQAYADNKIETF